MYNSDLGLPRVGTLKLTLSNCFHVSVVLLFSGKPEGTLPLPRFQSEWSQTQSDQLVASVGKSS